MHSRRILARTIVLVTCCSAIFGFLQPWYPVYGQEPTPIITNTEITATVSYDPSTYKYLYAYQITSSPANTGVISGVNIDISTNLTETLDIPDPLPKLPKFNESIISALDAKGVRILPVEMSAPTGWYPVPFSNDATASWVDVAPTDSLGPGQSLSGFSMSAPYVPGIRTIRLNPDISTWNLYPDADESEAVIQQQLELIKNLDFVGYTLGPTGIHDLISYWNHLRDNLNKAISIGWLPDATLANQLVTELASARETFTADDGDAAVRHLQKLILTVSQASNQQRRTEVRDLLVLNAERIIEGLP